VRAPGAAVGAGLGLDAADGAMLAVTLIWAFNNVSAKIALPQFVPLAFVLARLALATAAAFPVAALREPVRVPARGDWPRVVLVGGLGFAAYNALFILGLDRTSAFSVALLLSLGPVFTLLFAAALGIERIGPVQWAGVAVALVGVAVFVSDKIVGASAFNPTGDAIVMMAAACFAAYSLASRPLVVRYGPAASSAWTLLAGSVVLLPFAWGPAARQDWGAVTPAGWGALVFAALFSLLLAYILWTWAIARRGVGRTTPYLFLLPLLTGAMSAVLTGERFGPAKVAGAVLILVGTGVVRVLGQRLAGRHAARERDRRAAR
jgi:drug/metabolite transporter (DMT)-like permease